MTETPKTRANSLLKTGRRNIERAAISRARALNDAAIRKNRAIVERVVRTFELLKFLKIPTAPITSNIGQITATQDLQDLITTISGQLALVKNTVFANLDVSKNGEYERNQRNIANLMISVQAAATRLVEAASKTPPSEHTEDTQLTPPDTDDYDLNSGKQLKALLEELRQFLHHFIIRNKLDLARDTAITVSKLDDSHRSLDLLDQTAMDEHIDPTIDPNQLDNDWAEILYNLALTLSIFEERLTKIHTHRAEALLLLIDPETLGDRIERDTETEHNLRKSIDQKDKRIHRKLLAFLYRIIMSKELPATATPEKLRLEQIQSRIGRYADTIKKRRSIEQKRHPNS